MRCTRRARPSAPRAAARPDRGLPAPAARVAARRRFAYAGGLAGALAAIVLALVLALPGGTPGAPSVSERGRARRPRAHAGSPRRPIPGMPGARLHQNVGDVYFPNWTLALRMARVRSPHRQARRARPRSPSTTSGDASGSPTRSCPRRRWPSRRRSATGWNGTELRTLTMNGRLVVTWRRAGDTCVLSGDRGHGRRAAEAGGVEGPGGCRLARCSLTRSAPPAGARGAAGW